jgi:hypothetical protein
MPRYKISPLIDNMDPFACGFFKVLMDEWDVADEWSQWARTLENDEDTPDIIWDDTNSALLKDALLWIGSGIGVTPAQMSHHYLSTRFTIHQDHNGGTGDLKAAATLTPIPMKPFTYHWFHDSVALDETGTTDWNETSYQFDDGAARSAYDTTFANLALSRMNLYRALDYYDPFRPYHVRVAGWMFMMMDVFDSTKDMITHDISSLFSNLSIKTVPLDKDNSRFISRYRQMGIKPAPRVAGRSNVRSNSGRSRERRPRPNPTDNPSSDDDSSPSAMDRIGEAAGNVWSTVKSVWDFAMKATNDSVSDAQKFMDVINGSGPLTTRVEEAIKSLVDGGKIDAATSSFEKLKKEIEERRRRVEGN